ncbi:hypothetical protein N7495_000986 [Penicillium taxi]|uniref:uncharacterized protein n=1 Tax=Penicillium taxi TaxID=168475 RepID=UPI0025457255|nr:uncharacterized protein N7495_000986 [Penicillium taxi]KAJ5908304.1 hypothetical protein N7495_000986 [Penicillium taxi]
MTREIDLIVDAKPKEARSKLLEDNRFTVTLGNRLVFSGEGTTVKVELLRGEGRQLKLPVASAVPLRSIDTGNLP